VEGKVVYWVVIAMNVSLLIPQRFRHPARRVYFHTRKILIRGNLFRSALQKLRRQREEENKRTSLAHTARVEACPSGFTITDPEVHSDGEYSIEAVILKK